MFLKLLNLLGRLGTRDALAASDGQMFLRLLNHLGLYTRQQVPHIAAANLPDVLRIPFPDLNPDLFQETEPGRSQASVVMGNGLRLLLQALLTDKHASVVMGNGLRLLLQALLTDKHAHTVVELGVHEPAIVQEALADALAALQAELTFQSAQRRSRIRELYLAEMFAGIEEISIPVGAVNEETGHANAVDLLFVSAMAKHRQARRLFEIGTYMGRTSYHLTHASEGATVTTVNLAPETDARWGPYLQVYFRGRERAKQIHQVWADSTQMDTTPYRGQMDFVFVDGDHSYEVVKADTFKAFEVMAPGGMIVWHDYAAKSPGVYRFFEEFTRDRPVFRVRRTCLLVHIDGVDPETFVAHPMRPSFEQRSFRKRQRPRKAA
jgi:predicted O-methyltransferase YrrM